MNLPSLEDLGLPEQDSASEEEDEDEAPAPCLLRQDSASHGNQQVEGPLSLPLFLHRGEMTATNTHTHTHT